MKSYHPLIVKSYFSVGWGGWVGGWGGCVCWWLQIWRLKLISTQVVVEVEVGVELGNIHLSDNKFVYAMESIMTARISLIKIVYW